MLLSNLHNSFREQRLSWLFLAAISTSSCTTHRAYDETTTAPRDVAVIKDSYSGSLRLDRAQIFAVDGQWVGATTSSAEVPPGPHTIRYGCWHGYTQMSTILSGGGGAVLFEAEQGHTYQIRCENRGGKVHGWIHDKTTDQIVGKEVWIDATPKGLDEQRKRIAEIHQQAEEGDSASQFSFYELDDNDVERLAFLCRAADQQYTPAMRKLATGYWRGHTPGINKDLRYAYVWFKLTANSISEETIAWETQQVTKSMTPNELVEAEQILADWKPGQCERDLGLTDAEK